MNSTILADVLTIPVFSGMIPWLSLCLQEAHDSNDRNDLSSALGALSDGLEKLSEAEAMLRAAGDHAGADSLRAKAVEYGGFGTAVARRLSLGVTPSAAAAAAAAAVVAVESPGSSGNLAQLRQAIAEYETRRALPLVSSDETLTTAHELATASSLVAENIPTGPSVSERGYELLREVSL